jgi:HAD superfamily hydrolase (TIGR01662 family)
VTLAELLAQRPVVLLDFDGPVCAVFGGEQSAPQVARHLAALVRARGVDLPPEVDTIDDPFDILRAAATRGPRATVVAESALREAEVRAVATAPMTAGLFDALAAFRDSGHTLTIVSNNSRAAVNAFLTTQAIRGFVVHISARSQPDPALLKPHPYLVRRAIEANRTDATRCVLVGDSSTDITAARRAGTAVVAYANKPGKHDLLAAYRPDAVINHLHDLVAGAKLPYLS